MSGDCNCDAEKVFELAERTLDPDQALGVRAHLEECPGCREFYERNVDLNVRLGSLELRDDVSQSVRREVAMAIPTRSLGARLYWGALAAGLLISALLALHMNGGNLVAMASVAVGAVVSFASGFAEVASTVLMMGGPAILIALLVGTLVDVLIAAVLLSALRRRSRAA